MTNTTVKKRVYAVLWVDDYGSLKLRRRDVEWYHRHAGPLSLAVQCDDRFPWGFKLAFSSLQASLATDDFYSHHYHPQRYVGARAPKKVYDVLRLHCVVWSLLRHFTGLASKGILRIALIFALPAIFIVLTTLLRSNFPALIVLVFLYCIGIALLASWYYVRLPRSWEYPFTDRDFHMRSVLSAKVAFEGHGLHYPIVIRHGWNLPWEGSMEFYQSLGVLADASAVPVGLDKHAKIADREIEWHLPQPYFTSFDDDYSVPWDGVNESHRGLLELPVNLGNISVHGFGEEEKKLIRQVPEGGLISCYIHPQDNFAPIRAWVEYLKKHFDVQFISARDAVNVYRKVSIESATNA